MGAIRPPFGKITLATLLQAWIKHQKLAWWTIDSKDSWSTPRPIEDIVNQVKIDGGGVILMHDHDRKESTAHNYVINLTAENRRLPDYTIFISFRIYTNEAMKITNLT